MGFINECGEQPLNSMKCVITSDSIINKDAEKLSKGKQHKLLHLYNTQY